jgi:hypothetical protein
MKLVCSQTAKTLRSAKSVAGDFDYRVELQPGLPSHYEVVCRVRLYGRSLPVIRRGFNEAGLTKPQNRY